MKRTIENKVADAILERNVGEIKIDGNVYEIAPPSIATLILVSEIVSQFPIVREDADQVTSVLHHAKEFRGLGDLAAVLILGAKNLTETRTIRKKILGLTVHRKQVTVDKQAELAKLFLENVRPSVLLEVIVKRLIDLEVGDFFGITTSLTEVNILKPTKEVVD